MMQRNHYSSALTMQRNGISTHGLRFQLGMFPDCNRKFREKHGEAPNPHKRCDHQRLNKSTPLPENPIVVAYRDQLAQERFMKLGKKEEV